MGIQRTRKKYSIQKGQGYFDAFKVGIGKTKINPFAKTYRSETGKYVTRNFSQKGKRMLPRFIRKRMTRSTDQLTNRITYINERIGGKMQKLDKYKSKIKEKEIIFEAEMDKMVRAAAKDPSQSHHIEQMMLQKRSEFAEYTNKLKGKIERASTKIKGKIEKYEKKLTQYKNLLANKMEKSQKRLREGIFTTCKKPNPAFSRNDCLQIYGFCKGKGKGIDVNQILECMHAEDPSLQSITSSTIHQSMQKNVNSIGMRLRFLKRRRHLREIERLKKSTKILDAEKLAEERLKKDKEFMESDFTAHKMIQGFENSSHKTLGKTKETLSALKEGKITQEQVLSAESSRLAVNEVNKSKKTAERQLAKEMDAAEQASGQQIAQTVEEKQAREALAKEEAALKKIREDSTKPYSERSQLIATKQEEIEGLQNKVATAAEKRRAQSVAAAKQAEETAQRQDAVLQAQLAQQEKNLGIVRDKNLGSQTPQGNVLPASSQPQVSTSLNNPSKSVLSSQQPPPPPPVSTIPQHQPPPPPPPVSTIPQHQSPPPPPPVSTIPNNQKPSAPVYGDYDDYGRPPQGSTGYSTSARSYDDPEYIEVNGPVEQLYEPLNT